MNVRTIVGGGRHGVGRVGEICLRIGRHIGGDHLAWKGKKEGVEIYTG